MSLFYNPKTKKPQIALLAVYILVPALLIVVGFKIGGSIAEKNKEKNREKSSTEVFKKF